MCVPLHDALHGMYQTWAQMRHRHHGSEAGATAGQIGAVLLLWHLLGPQKSLHCDGPGQMFERSAGLWGW